ncbi:hypothetical protein OOK41_31545 [Micromonospora sp. NBC_01655]|uniref:hypothetical protein n=1 Tax=Micromonospora sp. NBC_01655 TaxID=2975983 RepID=UPI002254A594|nr:hypothetical protein [Micromonospora sp. NBC_01655]MCX4470432.1 hypothetical protein [Micromonospora sp. NBC_01655]MCX4474796.1 hypothetical protein [Micromonospora sp. NBC_01655]
MEHTMSPTAVAILLLLAIVVDYMSIGPNSLRDRAAFFMALPAIREGFNGSPADQKTVAAAGGVIQSLLDSTGGAYIAGASVNAILGAIIGLLWIYTIGCLLPVKLGKKLGRFATLSFPQSPLYRLNGKLWIVAIILGMMSDLPGGVVGDLTRSLVDIVTGVVAPLPALLFGAA